MIEYPISAFHFFIQSLGDEFPSYTIEYEQLFDNISSAKKILNKLNDMLEKNNNLGYNNFRFTISGYNVISSTPIFFIEHQKTFMNDKPSAEKLRISLEQILSNYKDKS